MKRTIFVLLTMLVVFVAVFTVLVLRPVPKVKAGHEGCSEKMLKGPYEFTATGQESTGYNFSFSMIATFAGASGSNNLTGSEFNAYLADTSKQYVDLSFTTSGSYTVNPDCSVNLTIPGYETGFTTGPFDVPITLNGVAVDTGGDEVAGIWYESGYPMSGTFDAKRIAQGQWNFF